MNFEPALRLQAALPAQIPLFHHYPTRRPFADNAFDPTKVRTAGDLPPYLVLGGLDESSFALTPDGWSALYRGAEADTHLALRYRADPGLYSLQQTWCGVYGNYAGAEGSWPLSRIVGQLLYLRFPSDWDRAAKERFERTFDVDYVEQPAKMPSFCGIPDGAPRTIAFPVAIGNLESVRVFLHRLAERRAPAYPVAAVAKLVSQQVRLVSQGTTNLDERTLVARSFADTGLVPETAPIHATEPDGTAVWTLQRRVYLVLIEVPFGGLLDLLTQLAVPRGPLHVATGTVRPAGMRPFVAPGALVLMSKSLDVWDPEHTTHTGWSFPSLDLRLGAPTPNPAPDTAEHPLDAALRIGREVAPVVCEILDAETKAKKRAKKVARKVAPQGDPLQALLALPDVQARIDAIGADLERPKKRRRFASIDPWDLASALGVELSYADSYSHVIPKQPLEDLGDFPAWENLELLQETVSEGRYAELEAQGAEIAAGTRTEDLAITAEEREAIQEACALRRVEDGAGWVFAQHRRDATCGVEVRFQVNIGDSGALFDLTGPYEIHDDGWPTDDSLYDFGER